MLKTFSKILFVGCFFVNIAKAEIINNIEIEGNLRVNTETIIMFSDVTIGQDLLNDDLNEILKKLYDTNFFEDVQVSLNNSKLKIIVTENPIIQSINIEGVKNKSLKKALFEKINLSKGSSFNNFKVSAESKKIQDILRKTGFYLSSIETLVAENNNNTVDLVF